MKFSNANPHAWVAEKEWFNTILSNAEQVNALKKIQLIVADIDGSLTDGSILYSAQNNVDTSQDRAFSVLDGYGSQKARENNITVALLSGGVGPSLYDRAEVLEVSESLCRFGKSQSKVEALKELQSYAHATAEETLMFGDDTLDLELHSSVALFATPCSSLFYICSEADIVIPRAGGNGAFRILIDLILYINNIHFAQDAITRSLQK